MTRPWYLVQLLKKKKTTFHCNTDPKLYSRYEFEAQVSKLYTGRLFNLFQDELRRSTAYVAKLKSEEHGTWTYVVRTSDLNQLQL